MADELDLSADEFLKMSTSQQIRVCRLLAARAQALANLSSSEHLLNYLRIAVAWDAIASDIERRV